MSLKSDLQVEVVIDTREKNPAIFPVDEEYKSGRIQIMGSKIGTLDTGDYSLVGYEDILRIERKAGFAELMGNLASGGDIKDRFFREMERLAKFKYKYILVESNISNDVMTLGVPQMRFVSPPASVVVKELLKIYYQYNIPFLFVGDSFVKTSRYLFEVVVRAEKAIKE